MTFQIDATPSEPSADDATTNNGDETREAKRQRPCADGAKTQVDTRIGDGDELPSPKLQRTFKCASSHLDGKEMFKFEASAVAARFNKRRNNLPPSAKHHPVTKP